MYVPCELVQHCLDESHVADFKASPQCADLKWKQEGYFLYNKFITKAITGISNNYCSNSLQTKMTGMSPQTLTLITTCFFTLQLKYFLFEDFLAWILR